MFYFSLGYFMIGKPFLRYYHLAIFIPIGLLIAHINGRSSIGDMNNTLLFVSASVLLVYSLFLISMKIPKNNSIEYIGRKTLTIMLWQSTAFTFCYILSNRVFGYNIYSNLFDSPVLCVFFAFLNIELILLADYIFSLITEAFHDLKSKKTIIRLMRVRFR